MFEDFSIQYMSGLELFGLSNLLSLFMILFFILLIWVVAIVFDKEDKTELKDLKPVAFAGVVGVIIIGFLIPTVISTSRAFTGVDESEAMIEHR